MRPLGKRRTRVQVQALTTTADALGQLVQTWTTVATVWALKRAMTGTEATNALQTKNVVSFVLETWFPRSLVTVTGAHRLLIGGKAYGIEWVNDVDDRHETLLVYCRENVVPAS